MIKMALLDITLLIIMRILQAFLANQRLPQSKNENNRDLDLQYTSNRNDFKRFIVLPICGDKQRKCVQNMARTE